MDHKDEVYGKLTTEADKTTFKKYEGNVYFFRALAYSDLIRMYCEAYDPDNAENQLGVSLYLRYSKEGEDSSIAVYYKHLILVELCLIFKKLFITLLELFYRKSF